jgi:hypothetical protein
MKATSVKSVLHVFSFYCVATMKGQRTPAQRLDDLAALTDDLTSAVRNRTLQLGRSEEIEHVAPQIRVQAEATAGGLSVRSLGSEKREQRVSGKPGSSSSEHSDSTLRRASDRLRKLRLEFDATNRSQTLSQSSSSSVDDTSDVSDGTTDRDTSGSTFPSTALRKNITKRRSNERARDSVETTSIPIDKLLARVPSARTQDAAYAKETKQNKPMTPPVPIPRNDAVSVPRNNAVSVQSPTPPTPGVKVSVPSPKPSPSVPDFTRRLIPTEVESPKLHKQLRNMWIRKKGIEEDMAEALEKGNDLEYNRLSEQHEAINKEMFGNLRKAQLNGDNDQRDLAPVLPAQVLDYDFDHNSKETNRPPPGRGAQPWQYDESSETAFMIWFSYEEEEFPYIVWHQMPVALLVEAAAKILQDNGENITKDHVVLMHDHRYMDATFERLSDHDIESEDVIDILINRGRSLSKSKQSDPDVQPGSPHDKGHKFYCVRRGRMPGIYRSWEECQTQVEGFPGCEFKSFRSKRDALDYMEMVVRTHDSHHSESKKYYGVRRGRAPGIYRSWNDCQIQVEGFSGCEFKSFTRERDAREYMASVVNMVEDIPSIFPQSGGLRQENAKIASLNLSQENANIAPLKSVDNRSQDKIKQAFKCPKFSGNTKDWKIWNKGFQRYLSIWDLAYVLAPNFFDDLPLTPEKVQDNKLVYFLLDDATQASPLASSYLRQAPAENGFEAYYTLHDGFVFAASTASTILLNELANFRFLPDESPTGMIMRLDELLQDMEMLPDGASMTFNDTQRIGYLLGALCHEPEWATVASTITSSQLRGDMTFRSACDELKFRCEAERAYEVLDRGVKPKRKVTAMVSQTEPILDAQSIETITTALVSSVGKRLNKEMAPATKDRGTRKKFHLLGERLQDHVTFFVMRVALSLCCFWEDRAVRAHQ